MLTPFTGDPNGLALVPADLGGTVATIKLDGSGFLFLFAAATAGAVDLLPWVYYAGRWYPHPTGKATADNAVNGGALWERFAFGDLMAHVAVQKAGGGTLGDGGKVTLAQFGGGRG